MNKKAVSIMIGYVLLIAGIIIVSAVVYTWMRSYVPREAPECPDGVSLFIEDSVCKDLGGGDYILNVSIKNNGRFDIDGYFIKATKTQEQEVATFDISEGITSGGNAQASVVLFPGGKLEPGNSAGVAEYDLDFPIYLIEVTPIRYETIQGKNKLVSCGNAIIKEKITC
jgi:hypothetical protein